MPSHFPNGEESHIDSPPPKALTDFQRLDGLRKDEFRIDPLGYQITDLTVIGVSLHQTFDYTLAPIANPIIIEITE